MAYYTAISQKQRDPSPSSVEEDRLLFQLLFNESACDDPTPLLAAVNAADDRKLDLRFTAVPQSCSPDVDHDAARQDENGSVTQTCRSVHWKKMSRDDLLSMSKSALNCLLEKLHLEVEEVSAALVVALQERHRLEDEVDIRFIAIEQLHKVPGKLLSRPIDQLTLPPSLNKVDALECQ